MTQYTNPQSIPAHWRTRYERVFGPTPDDEFCAWVARHRTTLESNDREQREPEHDGFDRAEGDPNDEHGTYRLVGGKP